METVLMNAMVCYVLPDRIFFAIGTRSFTLQTLIRRVELQHFQKGRCTQISRERAMNFFLNTHNFRPLPTVYTKLICTLLWWIKTVRLWSC